MIQRITQKILEILINNEAFAIEQKAVIAFGIEHGLRTAMEIILMLLTGLFMNVFWQSIVILISFMIVRIYAGGYHAKTPLQCVIKSWALFVGILLLHKHVQSVWGIQVMTMAIAGIWIYGFSPIQDVHKPLKEYEIQKYRKKAIKNYFIDVLVFCVGYVVGKEELASCIAMGMLMLLVMLVMGMIKNRGTKECSI